MAEIELSFLSRQCINRRFDSVDQMQQEIDTLQTERNQLGYGANLEIYKRGRKNQTQITLPHSKRQIAMVDVIVLSTKTCEAQVFLNAECQNFRSFGKLESKVMTSTAFKKI